MKDISECRERLHGIFNITVTPFAADGHSTLPGSPGASSGRSRSASTAY